MVNQTLHQPPKRRPSIRKRALHGLRHGKMLSLARFCCPFLRAESSKREGLTLSGRAPAKSRLRSKNGSKGLPREGATSQPEGKRRANSGARRKRPAAGSKIDGRAVTPALGPASCGLQSARSRSAFESPNGSNYLFLRDSVRSGKRPAVTASRPVRRRRPHDTDRPFPSPSSL